MTTSSSDVANEEQFFLTQADNKDESEEQTLERIGQTWQNAKQWVAKEKPSSLKTSMKKFTKIDGSTTSHSINGIKANAQIRVEQVVDLVLKEMKLKILGPLTNDEVSVTTDSRYKHYKANKDGIILKDGLLFRNYFKETNSVKYYEILIAKQLVIEVLRSLYGEFIKHTGIAKTIISYMEKYYFPKKGN